MTSSYLKAMQLTKQLEEKAKEEKKNRQQAEEEMQFAEDLIKSAKVSDINIVKAEELLVNANVSIQDKEYKEGLSHAIQAKEMAQQCFSDGIKSIIDSVDKLAELGKEVGADCGDGLEVLEIGRASCRERV